MCFCFKRNTEPIDTEFRSHDLESDAGVWNNDN